MLQALTLHSDSACAAVARIEVEAARPRADMLVLDYVVTGRITDLRLPPVTAAARADELWRHTCFEAFVRSAPSAAYVELNFAPSTQWAAYLFDSYRSGMRLATEIGAPRIEVQSTSERLSLRASLDLGELPGVPGNPAWRLGLSAVIEETSGRMSYWALAHPPGQADFHHPDCFAHELAAA